MFSPRLGCSSITFRQRPLAEALQTIRDAGFDEIDLGALPGVCDHVPFVLDVDAVRQVSMEVSRSGLRVRSVNGDIERARQLTERLAGSEVGVVMDFSHVVASGGDPQTFVETFSDRIAHVHLRDAVAGNINLSIGNGEVNFAAGLFALARTAYDGHFSLELETHDVSDEDRPAASVAAAQLVSSLLQTS